MPGTLWAKHSVPTTPALNEDSAITGHSAILARDTVRVGTKDVPTLRLLYRDVRLFRIFEGTTQIQQLVIARHMLREA